VIGLIKSVSSVDLTLAAVSFRDMREDLWSSPSAARSQFATITMGIGGCRKSTRFAELVGGCMEPYVRQGALNEGIMLVWGSRFDERVTGKVEKLKLKTKKKETAEHGRSFISISISRTGTRHKVERGPIHGINHYA